VQGTPLKGNGPKDLSLNDVQRLDGLRELHRGAPAVIFGNGWRLNLARSWRIAESVVTIGVNRAPEVIDTQYHVSIDLSGEATACYTGVRFGAARENRRPGTLGAFWSDYWKKNGMLVPNTSPPFSGLYAIEVAAFLGCSPIYLFAYDGDDRPGTSEGHFYEGKRCAPGLAEKHNAWLTHARKAMAEHHNPKRVYALTIDGSKPKVNNVEAFVDVYESGLLHTTKKEG